MCLIKKLMLAMFSIVFAGFCYGQEQDIVQFLQDVSVTIKAPSLNGRESQGSGVIFTRKVRLTTESDVEETVNFIWTAGHVVDGLRTVRAVVDPKTGQEKQVIEFRPAFIVKELIENGRRVGELKLEASVIKYSDADFGEDLAILMIRKRNFVNHSAKFYVDPNHTDLIIPVGTQLFHVGSLLGQLGANSMTDGIVSQVGRVLNLGSGTNTAAFDQTTVTAFPGSSGGGVFLATNDEHRGKYIGMLVRGAGETFNLIVPIRRMKEWSKEAGVEWALDDSVATPSLAELEKLPVEDIGITNTWSPVSADKTPSNLWAGELDGIGLQYRLGFTKTVILTKEN